MIEAIGFSTVLFPYQAPSLVVALELGGIPSRVLIRLLLLLALLTALVIGPLDYLWWRFLGYLG
jgi:hypothetical protein